MCGFGDGDLSKIILFVKSEARFTFKQKMADLNVLADVIAEGFSGLSTSRCHRGVNLDFISIFFKACELFLTHVHLLTGRLRVLLKTPLMMAFHVCLWEGLILSKHCLTPPLRLSLPHSLTAPLTSTFLCLSWRAAAG